MQQRHLSHESIGKLPGLEGGDESRQLLASTLFRVEVGHLRDIAHAALGLVAEDGLVRLGAVQPRRLPIAHLDKRHQVEGRVKESEEVEMSCVGSAFLVQPLAFASVGELAEDDHELLRLGWVDRGAVLEPHLVAVGMQQRHLSHEPIWDLAGLEGGDERRQLLGS